MKVRFNLFNLSWNPTNLPWIVHTGNYMPGTVKTLVFGIIKQ